MSSSKSYMHDRLEAGDIKVFEMIYNEQYTSLCHFAQRFVIDLDTASVSLSRHKGYFVSPQ